MGASLHAARFAAKPRDERLTDPAGLVYRRAMPADPSLPPNLRPGVFAGLADDYVRYRVPYPAPMLDEMLAGAAVPAAGSRLLDLACGTGRVALPIAHRFAAIRAIDLEPDMLDAGRREAARLGIGNIQWGVGRAEDVEAPASAFDLVTIGEAFHRLDRPRAAALAFGWLKPGGALATLGADSLMDGEAPWRRVVAEVVRSFVGEPARRLGAPNAPIAEEIAEQENALSAAGFAPVTSHRFATPYEWTAETLLGYLRSTSVLSRAALGARHHAFEAALADALLKFDPLGRYVETVGWGYTLARKP
jgi:ubiquinone/menaquinone biosynthesis C-methylase UbiE